MLSATIQIANRRALSWIRLSLFSLIALLVLSGLIVAARTWWFVRSSLDDLPDPTGFFAFQKELPQTSLVVAEDGTILAELPFENGSEVGFRRSLSALPQVVIHAILAAEDVRFFEHTGVDIKSILRAARANFRAGSVREGASTITQQLVRAVWPEQLGREQTLRRKVREAMLSLKVEKVASKVDILVTYANTVFLGNNAYGFSAGALRYFGKSVDELSVPEAATLAGLIQAPSRLDATKNPKDAKDRRNLVLDRMVRAGYISPSEGAAAMQSELQLAHVVLPENPAPWHLEQAKRWLKVEHPEQLARGQLRIELTADVAANLSATRAALKHIDQLGEDLPANPEVALAVIDLQSGDLPVLLGGTSFATSQFDRVMQACRQPGSAFKPFVYGAALETGKLNPNTVLHDLPVTSYDPMVGEFWHPSSNHADYLGPVIAEKALALSLNPPAIEVFDLAGAAAAIDLAHRLGISTEMTTRQPLVLGASCAKPIEMLTAYARIANRGVTITPGTIKRMIRGDASLFDRTELSDAFLSPADRLNRTATVSLARRAAVLDPIIAQQLRFMLQDVVRRGTATSARELRGAGGKTGTTNNNTDAWFVGFTERYAAVVWLGFDSPKQTLGRKQDGARAALPLWKEVMKWYVGEKSATTAEISPLVMVAVDAQTGLISNDGWNVLLRKDQVPEKAAQNPDFELQSLSQDF